MHFAKVNVTQERDGLSTRWAQGMNLCKKDGLCFVNPPFSIPKVDEDGEPVLNDKGKQKRSNVLHLWTKKCMEEGERGAEIILLTPSRTDTQWYHRHLRQAKARCFWEGRIKYEDPETGEARFTSPFPTMFSYWGPNYRLFAKVFEDHGEIIF